ncbi:N-acetyltransferase GCN5 [Pseudonocardia sulfidoxydans NBRC 16205]|uniref:N-acetyltransferase GCN5 n=1 Tax=Pseudonocardia sulfidoxydans NBRC 16205 TaxID=1223511 RepID=A0A511DJ29_9PSEU|nr:GNAT family N-acetyltransferase [Pseudonocardia sulfidoxydans]GEL24825.1 N-acetyltransferase GCN5 [Pseudonocardia sulfidoxydans NBRC 16205]
MSTQGHVGGGDVLIREVDRATFDSGLFDLLAQLRPGFTRNLFEELTTVGYDQGLRFIVADDSDGIPIAAAGYRVLSTSRGRILYVDDLVTSEALRSRGFASQLLAELRTRSRDAGCVRVELDSGVTNTRAHRFYLRERLDIGAYHFAMRVDV